MRVPYRSRNPHAGVVSYELEDKAIILDFPDGRFRYVYNEEAPGPAHVEAMKRLAREGKGLSTYVSQNIGANYAAKLPRKPPSRSPGPAPKRPAKT